MIRYWLLSAAAIKTYAGCIGALERHSVGMKLVMKIEDTMMLKDFKQSVSHNLSDVFVLELQPLSLRAVRILRGK